MNYLKKYGLDKNDKKHRENVNYRFIRAIATLESIDVIVRYDRDKGFSYLADVIFGDRRYGNLINKFMSYERLVTFEQAHKICEKFGISEDFIFKGVGSPIEVASWHSITERDIKKRGVGSQRYSQSTEQSNVDE